MGKSVKLTDGSYIDSEGIYDVTQSKTQKELNARNVLINTGKMQAIKIQSFFSDNSSLKITLTWTGSHVYNDATGLLFGRRGIYAIHVIQAGSDGKTLSDASIVKLSGLQISTAPTIAYSDKVCTITLPTYYASVLLLCAEYVENISITSI